VDAVADAVDSVDAVADAEETLAVDAEDLLDEEVLDATLQRHARKR
jgi:hypothetical protein